MGAASPGVASIAATISASSCSDPAKSTSRLLAKWRKNVRAVNPARSAMSATVVWS